jgi:hypothetical protein
MKRLQTNERRDFMKFLVLISAAFTLGQVSIGVQNWYRKHSGLPAMQRIASVDDLPVDGALVVFGERAVGDDAADARFNDADDDADTLAISVDSIDQDFPDFVV